MICEVNGLLSQRYGFLSESKQGLWATPNDVLKVQVILCLYAIIL